MEKQINILQKWYLPVLVILLGLNSFCKFVVTKSFEENSKLHFHDKELPVMGSKSERLAHQFSELLVSPKTVIPPTIYFQMTNENPIVNVSQYATFTQLQQLLVNNHFNLENDYDFLRLYYETLPFSYSQEHAFLAVNQLRYNRHKSYRFKSYQSFTNFKNAALC